MPLARQLLLKLALEALEKVLTPEVVAKARAQGIAWLHAQAAKTQTNLDDKLVDIVAKAIGV